mmetsp:Transcript_6625/g.9467  ORF Transcript_6625/g.9467 Transcript_6625/m.9467 type:complete len:124 (+) Transcript_6625:1279-1650(+)
MIAKYDLSSVVACTSSSSPVIIITERTVMMAVPRSGVIDWNTPSKTRSGCPELVIPEGYRIAESSQSTGPGGQCPVRRHANDVRGMTAQTTTFSTILLKQQTRNKRKRLSQAMEKYCSDHEES